MENISPVWPPAGDMRKAWLGEGELWLCNGSWQAHLSATDLPTILPMQGGRQSGGAN